MSDSSLPQFADDEPEVVDHHADEGDQISQQKRRKKRKQKRVSTRAAESASALHDVSGESSDIPLHPQRSDTPDHNIMGNGKKSDDIEREPLVSSQDLYKRSAYVNVVLMSVAFFFVFLAFSGAQNFATSRTDAESENVGGISLGIVYSVYAFSGFVASYIVEKIGLKASFVVGGLAYTLYVATNIYYTIYFVIPASVIVGVGAAVIWTAEGAFITWASQYHDLINKLPEGSTLGNFNGLFFSIFQANQFVGNLVLAFLFGSNLRLSIIFIVTTTIAFCGSMMFFLVRPLTRSMAYSVDQSRVRRYLRAKRHKEKEERRKSRKIQNATYATVHDGDSVQNGEAEAMSDSEATPYTLVASKNVVSKSPSIFDAIAMWKQKALLLLLPVTIYSGFSQTFIFGEFPPLIIDEAEKFYAMAAFGFADMLCSMLLGKVSDRTGRLMPLGIGFLANSVVFVYLLVYMLVPELSEDHDFWVYSCLAVLLGIGDAAYNTQIYALFGTIFDSQAPVAFANFKIFQSGATGVGFFYRTVVSLKIKLIVTLSWLVLGTAIVFVSPITRKAATKVIAEEKVSTSERRNGTVDQA